jgi:hypothetical protein
VQWLRLARTITPGNMQDSTMGAATGTLIILALVDVSTGAVIRSRRAVEAPAADSQAQGAAETTADRHTHMRTEVDRGEGHGHSSGLRGWGRGRHCNTTSKQSQPKQAVQCGWKHNRKGPCKLLEKHPKG